MTKKSSKPILILLLIIFAALIAVLVFGILDIRTKNTEISRIVNEADQAAENERLIQSIKELQSEAAENLEAFGEAVFMDDKLVPLIETIEGLGRSLGLETRIASVSEVEDKKSAEPKIIKITIEATDGSWSSVFSFLRAIENLPHRVMVEDAGLSKEGDDWRLRLAISLYSFK